MDEKPIMRGQEDDDTRAKAILLRELAKMPPVEMCMVPTEPCGQAYAPTKKFNGFRVSFGLCPDLFGGNLMEFSGEYEFFFIVVKRDAYKRAMEAVNKEIETCDATSV